MKAIDEARLRIAIRAALSMEKAAFIAIDSPALVENLVSQVMKTAVEVQRPDTILKTEYDLLLAKNRTLVGLMGLMTDKLHEYANSGIKKETRT